MKTNISQTFISEVETFCALIAPKLLDYFKQYGTPINDIEVATNLEGITTLPGRYFSEGVNKNVLVPLDLLTLNVREKIKECQSMIDQAKTEIDKLTKIIEDSRTATKNANDAANKVTAKILEIAEEKKSTLEACTKALEATKKALESAETANLAAKTAKENAYLALEVASHRPKIMGHPGTWWIWNPDDKKYHDTQMPAAGKSPYINLNTYFWMVWDDEKMEYVDSGVYAFPYLEPSGDFVDSLMAEWENVLNDSEQEGEETSIEEEEEEDSVIDTELKNQ